MDNEKTLKAAIYVRVSTPEQVEWFSPEGQVNTIKKYIEARNNLEFAGERYIYQDLAVSGADPIDTREWFSQLINDIRYSPEKPFDVILVYKLDRFARKLSILLEVVDELEDLWVWFVSTQESLDTNNAFGKAMLGILGVFSELERDMILERTKMWIDEWLESGSWYRTRRYGYIKDNDTWEVIVVTAEASVVKDMYEMLVYKQKTVRQICAYLEDNKILNPSTSMKNYGGKRSTRWPYSWADKTVRTLLREKLYLWRYYYNKEHREYTNKRRNEYKTVKVPSELRKLSPIEHQPIIAEDLFEKAQAILDAKSWRWRNSVDYLLSGLLKCDCCTEWKHVDRVSWVWYSSHKVRSYRCRWRDSERYDYICPTTSIKANEMETLVIAEVKKLIANPQWLIRAIKETESLWAHKKMIEREMQKVEVKLTGIIKKIENNKELRQDGGINRNEFQNRMKKLQEEKSPLVETQKRLKKAFKEYFEIEAQQKILEILEKITSNLDDLFTDRKKCKELLNLLIEEIVIFSDLDNDTVLPWRKKEGDRYIQTSSRFPQWSICRVWWS